MTATSGSQHNTNKNRTPTAKIIRNLERWRRRWWSRSQEHCGQRKCNDPRPSEPPAWWPRQQVRGHCQRKWVCPRLCSSRVRSPPCTISWWGWVCLSKTRRFGHLNCKQGWCDSQETGEREGWRICRVVQVRELQTL